MYSGFFKTLSGVFTEHSDLSNSPRSEKCNLFSDTSNTDGVSILIFLRNEKKKSKYKEKKTTTTTPLVFYSEREDQIKISL